MKGLKGTLATVLALIASGALIGGCTGPEMQAADSGNWEKFGELMNAAYFNCQESLMDELPAYAATVAPDRWAEYRRFMEEVGERGRRAVQIVGIEGRDMPERRRAQVEDDVQFVLDCDIDAWAQGQET